MYVKSAEIQLEADRKIVRGVPEWRCLIHQVVDSTWCGWRCACSGCDTESHLPGCSLWYFCVGVCVGGGVRESVCVCVCVHARMCVCVCVCE